MNQIRIHGTVRGRVQGVCFRHYTREQANMLGVTGWVRNNPDSTVEFEAQGSEEKIAEFTKFVRNGPPAARVEDAKINRREPIADEKQFGVRYY